MTPQSMTHKILARRSGRALLHSGEVVEADVDMCFTHDPVLEGLRQMFYAEFGPAARVWDPSRIALFQDHLVPAKDAASRRLAMAMDSFAAEQGIANYYPYGRDYGVCHIVMCEKGHVRPGHLVLGTDSHSVTYGAFNALGTGVGMVDMLNVFRTGKLWLIVPEVIRVRVDAESTASTVPGLFAAGVYVIAYLLSRIGPNNGPAPTEIVVLVGLLLRAVALVAIAALSLRAVARRLELDLVGDYSDDD